MFEKGWERGMIKPCFGATARECLRFDFTEEGIIEAQNHVDRLIKDEALFI